MSLPPGAKLGPYEILGTLGVGGVGEVYRARDTLLKRDVAIKVLAGSYSRDPEKLRQFQQEAEAAAALNHPNILSIYQIGEQDGVPYIVTELLHGKTLREHRGTAALPCEKVLDYARQIAHGLAAAHAKRVVHRDLKPDNLFVTDDGRVKILDFGLAELMPAELPSDANAPTAEQMAEPGKVIGTLRYMSPEQVRGHKADARSDIFAFGAILYEMLAGKRAFQGATYADVIGAIIKESPPPLSQTVADIPPGLERIVFRCLEKNPAERFQSASDLAFALEALTDTQGTIRPPVGVMAAPTRTSWPNAVWFLGAAVVLLILTLRFWPSRSSSPPTHAIRSIVVLPFQNVSGDPSQDYFVEGMTDEVTTELANIGALQVVSRTSAMRYKTATKTLPQIAQELKVDGVIEGSVLRSGGTVRITTQLVEAKSDKQLWARSYTRELRDVVQLQSELAHDIAEEIRITVTPQEQQRLAATRTVDPQAYEAYLKGRFHWNKETPESLREARKYFEQAISVDPKYAPAYAGLADFYWATDELKPQEAMRLAKQNALKALDLDNELAEGHKTLAMVKFYADWDWAGAETEFRRALELNPNYSEGHRLYSVYLSELGRGQEALKEVQTAQRLDPLSLTAAVTVGWAYYYARQYDRAVELCRYVIDLDPNFFQGHDCLGSAYLAERNFTDAIGECQRSVSGSGHAPIREASLGRAYALAGKSAEARQILGELQAAATHSYVPPYIFAMVYAALGDKDQAFTWLDRGYQEHDPYLVRLRVDDAVDPLRSDARFSQLLQRIGLAQLAS